MASFYDNLSWVNNDKLPTRGGMQKMRRQEGSSNFITKLLESVFNNRSKDSQQVSESLSTIPKAPSFKYKNPVTDNNIAYWELFVNDDIMSRYDDLMGVLDNTDKIDTLEGKREYINQLKNTTDYKDNKSVQTWVDDLESEFYGMGAKELSYPTALLRSQMAIAKKEYEKEKRKGQGGR